MRPDLLYEEKNNFVESNIEGEMIYFSNFNRYNPENEDPKFLIRELRKLLARKDYIKSKIIL